MPDFTIRDPQSGRTMTVRGDSAPSEQELEQLFASGGQTAPQEAPAQPHPNQQLYDTMQGVGKWAARAIGGAFMGEPGVEAADSPGLTLASAALPVAGKYLPGLAARTLGISSARAGQNIQAATQAAAEAPVNVEKVGEAGLRALDLKAAGGRLPRAAEQFMRRITDPEKAELTFEEARDFYSNISRLSANEYNNLNPTMQRQVGAMRSALHEALVDSAETVGKGQQYAKGISEYRRSFQAQELAKKVAKAVGVGAPATYALHKVTSAIKSGAAGSRSR